MCFGGKFDLEKFGPYQLFNQMTLVGLLLNKKDLN